jgi:hypothetical protein
MRMTKKATGAASPARVAEALVKAKARAQAERDAEAEASRVRDMFEKDRAAFARRYGAIR